MRLPFESLFERRGVRLPSGITSVGDLMGRGGPTPSGATVDEGSAEALPVVFACVRVISSAIAQLPLKLYRRGAEGHVEAADHPLAEVLHSRANAEMTSYELRSLLAAHTLLWGSAYAEIERNARGQVTALWPLQPWRLRVDRDAQRRLRFTYTTSGGRSTEWLYDPHRPPIFRLQINSLDGITGRSVVTVLRDALGLSVAQERFAGKFFGNGATFGGLLSTDEPLDDAQERKELRDEIAKTHAGADNAHRLLVLGGGFKFTSLSAPLEDLQFLESRKFERSVLCGAFGVPPHMVGDLERATFSNIEHESLRWLRDGLDPHLVNWEAAIGRDLIGTRGGGEYYARFTRAAAVRGDLRSRSEALAIQRRLGVISANEWRALEELNPIGAEDGGDAYVIIGGGSVAKGGEEGRGAPGQVG